jgi:3-methyladenine DNA glycosylase/8-oxoguanine DNA glycosylase
VTSVAGATAQRRYRPAGRLDLDVTLWPHMRGSRDPCHRVTPDGAHWRTWRTPSGPATLRVAADRAAGEIDAQAWGAGADWALEGVPALLGAHDDRADDGADGGWAGLEMPTAALRETKRRLAGMRLSRSGRVFEALAPAIFEQLVTGAEARRAWAQLLARYATPAPGPGPDGMRVFPEPAALREIPDWEWHRLGLDGRRRRCLLIAAQLAGRLDAAADLDVEAAGRLLLAIPGIGPWTVAETLQRSHGAADLISLGDYGLPNLVGSVFTGRPRTDEPSMIVLLEPYRPHRQRVVRLVEACGARVPRYGPRMALRDYRRL